MGVKRLILATSAAYFAMASTAFANKPTDGGLWLQEAATPVMVELTNSVLAKNETLFPPRQPTMLVLK